MQNDKDSEVIRPDFIFSYWIFAIWILYEIGVLNLNPKFLIILGIIENSFLLSMKVYSGNCCSIPSFILINIFIKIIPLMTVINSKITNTDVVYSILIFILYLLWISVNNKLYLLNVVSWLTKKGKHIAPFEHSFNSFFKIKC